MTIPEIDSAGKILLVGYLHEKEMAKQRDVKVRTLQHERQRGSGPPWVKVGRDVYYSIDGFRNWLRAIERSPVRSPKIGAAKKASHQLEAI